MLAHDGTLNFDGRRFLRALQRVRVIHHPLPTLTAEPCRVAEACWGARKACENGDLASHGSIADEQKGSSVAIMYSSATAMRDLDFQGQKCGARGRKSGGT